MFIKIIKSVSSIIAITIFLSACGTTSSTKESAEVGESAGSTTGSESATTSGSQRGSISEGLEGPLDTVLYFEFNSSLLSAESRALLDAHVLALKAAPRAVRLEGHADERGTREYNIALGERRGQAVRTYLVSQGVRSPIEVVSYGEERPAVDASNESAWYRNRRVEIK